MEGSVAGFEVFLLGTNQTKLKQHNAAVICRVKGWVPDCGKSLLGVLLTLLFVLPAMLYFFLFCFFLNRGLNQQRSNSSMAFKLYDTITRIQLRLRFPAFVFFTFSLLLEFYVSPFSCTSIFTTWPGMLPGQITATVLTICMGYLGAPRVSIERQCTRLLQVWLQEYAWLERDLEERRVLRNRSLSSFHRHQISNEPMFCVETMLKCLAFSILVYEYDEVEGWKEEIEAACELFNPPLTGYKLIWDRVFDNKCLLAWNEQTIVIAFRGTASMSNVLSDLKAWHTLHWPRRGHWWNHARVHTGFAKLWLANGFDQKFIGNIKELLSSGAVKRGARLLVTGHSLGGAQANLSAFDLTLVKEFQEAELSVSCTTFGAPRTGNHKFASELQEHVPDLWNVINDQDMVARAAKFFRYFKRGGHRIILNAKGDMVVRPNPLEASLRLIPFSGSVTQHLLTAYLKSLAAIFVGQFTCGTSSQADRKGALKLIEAHPLLQAAIERHTGLEMPEFLDLVNEEGALSQKRNLSARKLKRAKSRKGQGHIEKMESAPAVLRDHL